MGLPICMIFIRLGELPLERGDNTVVGCDILSTLLAPFTHKPGPCTVDWECIGRVPIEKVVADAFVTGLVSTRCAGNALHRRSSDRDFPRPRIVPILPLLLTLENNMLRQIVIWLGTAVERGEQWQDPPHFVGAHQSTTGC